MTSETGFCNRLAPDSSPPVNRFTPLGDHQPFRDVAALAPWQRSSLQHEQQAFADPQAERVLLAYEHRHVRVFRQALRLRLSMPRAPSIMTNGIRQRLPADAAKASSSFRFRSTSKPSSPWCKSTE